MSMATEVPSPILADQMVSRIRERAQIVRKQIATSSDAARIARLTGLYDAYVADLQDAVRIAAGRIGRRETDEHPAVNISREAIEHLLDDC